jgi:hypothetical protein
MIYLILIGLFNALSELSNHGKLNHWGFWFSQLAWTNKNNWKPYPMWRWWPFIIFTDLFHFAKTIWVVLMCICVQFVDLEWYYSFMIYSCSFSVFYWVFPFLKVK